jgi:hypothetical protein
VEIAEPEVVAVTNERGDFHFSVEGSEPGEVVGSLTIQPEERPAYTVEDLAFPVTSRRGDGTVLAESYVVDPYIDFLGELFDAETGKPVSHGSEVTFYRTGGVPIAPDPLEGRTDLDGRFYLEGVPSGPGEVLGRMTVAGVVSGEYGVRTIPEVRLQIRYLERPLDVQGVWHLGTSMNYVGELRHRGSGDPVVGATVEFRRTGGIAVTPEALEAVTDANGRFPMILTPERNGTLVGDLVIRPREPYAPVTFTDVSIPTSDTVDLKLLRVWTIGSSLGYIGELVWADTGAPIAGVTVRLRRTGGIAVDREVYETVTNDAGRFRMSPNPLAAGTLEAVLEVDRPNSAGTYTTPVTLDTFESDEIRFAGVWHVPR